MEGKISAYGTESLKDMAIRLANDLSSEATMVVDAILSVLSHRMKEDEFVAFCEQVA